MPKKKVENIPPYIKSILDDLEPLINKPLELASYLLHRITVDEDPLHLTKLLALHSQRYKKKNFQSKLPSAVLTALCNCYKDCTSHDEDFIPSLHQCAFDVAIICNDMKLYLIVNYVFELPMDETIVLQKVNELLQDNSFKEAYRAIDAFDLEKYFEPEEVLYPFLFLKQDHFVKKYLRKCPSKRIPFVTGLDRMASIPYAHEDFLRSRGIIIDNKPSDNFNKQWFFKKIASYVEMFDVDIRHCPNLLKHRISGAMNYLFNKLFKEKTISYEAFEEMVMDTVEGHRDVQFGLLWKLLKTRVPKYGMAVRLAEKFNISRKSWPNPIRSAPSSYENFAYKQEYDLHCLPTNSPDFLKFRLTESEIVMIDTSEKLLEAVNDIAESFDVVGVDAEWKPNLGVFKEKVAILQLAVWDAVYLVDVLTLNRPGMFHVWDTLFQKIFCNKDILKLGYGIQNDLEVLLKTLDFKPMSKNYKPKNVVDFCLFLSKLKTDFPEIYKEVETLHEEVVSDNTKACKGLALLCQLVLGHPLSKMEQFSNWERRPLRPAQMTYAALDAHCLLMAYEVFYPLLKSKDLDWKKVFEHKPEPKKGSPNPKTEEDTVKNFKAVVDHNQTDGTIKILQKMGADVVYLVNEDPMSAIELALEDNRVLITLEENYERVINHLPKEQVYVSQSFTPYKELSEIIFRFNLLVKETNFPPMCTEYFNKLASDNPERFNTLRGDDISNDP